MHKNKKPFMEVEQKDEILASNGNQGICSKQRQSCAV